MGDVFDEDMDKTSSVSESAEVRGTSDAEGLKRVGSSGRGYLDAEGGKQGAAEVEGLKRVGSSGRGNPEASGRRHITRPFRTWRLFVVFPSGKQVTVMWNRNDTVSHVKSYLEVKTGVPQTQQVLMWAGSESPLCDWRRPFAVSYTHLTLPTKRIV